MTPRNAAIIDRYKRGDKLKPMAAEYGISFPRLREIIKLSGCERRPSGRPRLYDQWGERIA